MRPATISKLCAAGEALAANGHRVRTTWVEAAAGGRINQTGNLGASTADADFTAHGEIGNACVFLRIDTVRVGCSGDQ